MAHRPSNPTLSAKEVRMDRPIVVAVDGSDAAKAATKVALELARAAGDKLLFVTAWRELRGDFGLPYATLMAPDIVDVERDWARDTLAAAVAEAEQAGVQAESVSRHGRPAHEIVAVAREHDARLIVVGSHGFGPVEGLLLGSVSAGVLRHSRCPVLVVPEPAR
jgi:nucleotide-binding universal stress UspA family protein